MTFRADDGKTAGLLHAWAELDIGTTTRHVGGDCHSTRKAGVFDDLSFFEVQLSVQHVVFDVFTRQHAAQQLRHLDGGSTDEDRTSGIHQLLNLVDDSVIFLTFCLVNQVFVVDTGYRLVGRNHHHVEFVDIPELARLRLGGTCHTGELMVHPEVVLQSDGGIGLCRRLDVDVFLSFHCLMQAIRPTAAFHDTACLLVDDLHLVVDDDVVDVFLKQSVRLEQLLHGVHTVRLLREHAQNLRFLKHLLFVAEAGFLHLGYLRAHVRDDEERRVVVGLRQLFVTFIGEDDGVELLVDHEIQLIVDDMHVFALFLHVETFGLKQQRLHAFLREELDEGVVLRQAVVGAEQLVGAVRLLLFCGVRICQYFLGVGETHRHEAFLSLVELHHVGFQLEELLVVAMRYRTADDERRTGIVDQHGVDLVDDGVVVFRALHQLLRETCHVVTQVVEAELVVGAVGDVGVISRTALG